MTTKRSRISPIVRRGIYTLFTIGTTASIFIYLFSVVSPQEVIGVIKEISWPGVWMFVIFSIFMNIARTWRYMVIIQLSGFRPGGVVMYLVTLVRNLFADLLPARLGTLIYIYLINTRVGIPFAVATSSFAISFLFDIIALAVLAIFVAAIFTTRLFPPLVIVTAGLLILGACLVITAYLPAIFRGVAKVILKLEPVPRTARTKFGEMLSTSADEIERVKKKRAYPQILALSLLVRIGKYLSLYAILIAIVSPLGYGTADFPFGKVFLGISGAELSASLPISGIAGFGAYEGVWTLIFGMLGYSQKLAALTSVSHHLLTQIYGYLLGAVALLVLLLPLFADSDKQKKALPRSSGLFFWGRLSLMACLLAASCLLFVSVFEGRQAYSASRDSASKKSGAKMAEPADLKSALDGLTGRVVFQREDGIYMQRVGGGDARKIVPAGSYPRWSPDGTNMACIIGDSISLYSVKTGRVVTLSKASQPLAVAFHPSGKEVLFIEGNRIKAVEIASKEVRTVMDGERFREIDMASKGTLIAVTVKKTMGYYVEVIDNDKNTRKRISRGCSASLSPAGGKVTVNVSGHLKLNIFDSRKGNRVDAITAPRGATFDNQYWSNNPDWIASRSEGDGEHVYLHQVSTNRYWKITSLDGSDRPDVFLK